MKDPVNFIFYGGLNEDPPETVFCRPREVVSLTCVQYHIANDWRTEGTRMNATVCRSSQYMVFRHQDANRSTTTDRDDRQLNTGAQPACASQFHVRFWDDYEHKSPDHGGYDQWVVGGVHHERRTRTLGHSPDRPWDDARVSMYKAMSRHCRVRRWKHHAGAARPLQGFESSGWILRVSMTHRSQGC
jgi:hypothetical protein